MAKTRRRLLSLVLSLVMALSLIPATALAGDGSTIVRFYIEGTGTPGYNLSGVTGADGELINKGQAAAGSLYVAPNYVVVGTATSYGIAVQGLNPGDTVSNTAAWLSQYSITTPDISAVKTAVDAAKTANGWNDIEFSVDGYQDLQVASIGWEPSDAAYHVHMILTPRSYTVTYNGNGGTLNGQNTVTEDWSYSAAGYTVATNDKGFAWEGHTFDGWYKDAACTEPAPAFWHPATQEESLTLYAKWTPVTPPEPQEYTITVSVTNGKATVGTDSFYTSKDFTVGSGESLTVGYAGYTNYALDTVTVDGVSVYVEREAFSGYTFENVTADHSIEVIYSTDSHGGGPDGIPDCYQATITYKVVNGRWSNNQAGNLTKMVTIKEYQSGGTWGEPSVAPTLGSTIPTGMKPTASYTAPGEWNQPINAETPVTGDATYTYTFSNKVQYTVTGSIDNGTITDAHTGEVYTEKGTDGTVSYGQTVEYGMTAKMIFTPAPGYEIYSITKDGKTTTRDSDPYFDFTFNLQNGVWTYTKTQVKKNDTVKVETRQLAMDIKVEHRYYGGPLDTDKEKPSEFEEYGLPSTIFDTDTLSIKPNENFSVPALSGAPLDAGYTFYGYALLVVNDTAEELDFDENAHTWSGSVPAGAWGKLVYYYAPRTDLSYTVEYYYDGVKGDAPAGADEGGTGTYGASITEVTYPGSTDVNGVRYNYEKAEGLPLTISATESENVIKVYYTKVYIPPYIPPVNPVDPGTDIEDENVPLADLPGLNTVDHYAYIAGYPDGTVRPNGNITRAEVATIFFRLFTDEYRETYWATSNPFSDVAFTAWYNNGVSTAANAGIVAGYPDGTFLPNNNITRAEFATIAARFLSEAYAGPDLFTDISGHWAAEYINRAANAGWISGYPDGSFHPDAYITRAEAMTLVNNMLGRMPHEDHLLADMKVWPDNPETAWYYEAVQEATNSHDYDWTVENEVRLYEIWTEILPERDWAALEKEWSNAYSSTGADVIDNMNTGR